MKHLLTILLLFGVYSSAISQVAVIDDEGGYTNVRLEANTKSAIIYRLKADQVFWYGEDYYDKKAKWTSVYITKNDFSIDGSPEFLHGYVYKSEIRPLNEEKKYTGAALRFEYVMKPFSKKDKIIDYKNGWITAINGLKPWGIDGGTPKTEVDKINISLNENEIVVPKILVIDIYECDNEFDIYKIKDTYFVHQWNSDGAGSYEIVWVITKHGIKQRLVGTII